MEQEAAISRVLVQQHLPSFFGHGFRMKLFMEESVDCQFTGMKWDNPTLIKQTSQGRQQKLSR